MKNHLLLFVMLCLAVLSVSSCYYDKADIVYPPAAACDTTGATFSGKVLPLLNSKCNLCHGGTAAAGAGIKLDTYAAAKLQATNGKLVGSITHAAGFKPMPQGTPQMPACEIAVIKAWVNAGALNN